MSDTTKSPSIAPAGEGRLQRLLRGDLTDRQLAVVLMLPAAVLIFSLVIYPVGRLVWLSLQDFRLTAPHLREFVGLDNYTGMFTDSGFLSSMRVTAIYGIGSIVLPAIMGLIMALIVNGAFKGRWIARVAVILPWAMPHSLSALTWAWILNTQRGVANDILLRTGIISDLVNWLGDPTLAMGALIFATTWKTGSFVALILLAGLQSIPDEFYDSAAVDGAGPFQRLMRITLPMLRPHFMIALIFRTIVAIQLFDFPYALTQGGPGISTRPLSMYVYRVTLGHMNFGYGAALAIVMSLLIIVLTVMYMRLLRER